MSDTMKEELVEWISRPENEGLLETIKLIKETSESKDWFDGLNEQEKESIKRGQKNHRDGDTLGSKEFWEKHA